MLESGDSNFSEQKTHNTMSQDAIRYNYRIKAPDQPDMVFSIYLDGSTFEQIIPDFMVTRPARWTRLSYCQCDNCTLDKHKHAYCPLALVTEPLVHELSHIQSTSTFSVEVSSGERSTHFEASAQDTFGSLIGLIIATSGCPHTLFLKPMARFHQPLAHIEETFYRVASMYRLAQYYRRNKGLEYDPGFTGLIAHYDAIRKVNIGIKQRLIDATREDATINAIGILDALAMLVSVSLEEELDRFDPVFEAYLRDV